MLSSTTLNNNRVLDLLLTKVDELTNFLVVLANVMNEQEARLDIFLGKIGQFIDSSHNVASAPERGPTAKRQRSSRPTIPVGLAPTESSADPFTSGAQTLNPSSQAGPSSGVDPSGIASASNFIKEVWGQIQFASDWQTQDSNSLLEISIKHENKKEFHWRPDETLDRGAKCTKEGEHWSICLIKGCVNLSISSLNDNHTYQSSKLLV